MRNRLIACWSGLTFALTIFLSAFLLFEVQPILSKFILPWFGGSPMVWTTCMVFFQTVLFGGYLYAHLIQQWFGPRWQAAVHLALLTAAVLLLPIAPDAAWKPLEAGSPTWRIIAFLAVSVGLPYFMLSTTGPLVQAWFSRTFPGRSPYRLYALSNIGSLLALLSYPFYVESTWPVGHQTSYWSWGFIAFAALCGITAVVACFSKQAAPVELATAENSAAQIAPPPTAGRKLAWLTLPALASFMLLATTNHVCQDVAAVPLLWVMPLGLYLATFIICFDHERWYARQWVAGAAVVVLCLATGIDQLITAGAKVSLSFIVELTLYFAAMFLLCMVCHGELARLKPSTKHLTLYYLMISAGGALGGLFVSLVAPQLFSTFFEWRIGLVVGCVLAAAVVLRAQSPNSLKRLYYFAPALVLLFVGFNYLPTLDNQRRHEVNVASRNFYGVVRVIERDSDDPQQHRLQLYSGRIVHGVQFLDDAKRAEPTTYYGTETGIGRVFEFFGQKPDLRVGIIGLGAGTMAAYAQPGQVFRFYEINPDMVRLAKQYFHYLSDCRGETEIVLGDGRLSLEHEPPQHFDLLVLDAFSGDAIPAHLLTKEAFEVFRRQLKPQGAIAVHISNRYLNLAPVVCGVSKALGLSPLAFESAGDPAASKFPAQWIVLSDNPELIAKFPLAVAVAREVRELPHGYWTDDRSNLFEILK